MSAKYPCTVVPRGCRLLTEQTTGVFEWDLARIFRPAFGHPLESFLQSLNRWRLGFRVQGSGFRVQGLGLRVYLLCPKTKLPP